MKRSFQQLYTRVQDEILDSSSATLTIIKDLINESYAEAVQIAWIEDESRFVRTTIWNTDSYYLPNDFSKLRSFQLIEVVTSWTTTSTTAWKLVNSSASFWSTLLWKIVYNTTDWTFATISNVDSATTLSVSDDIFTSWKAYVIWDWTKYIWNEVPTHDEWNILKSSIVNSTSNILTSYFIRNNKIELYPMPDTSNRLLVFDYLKNIAEFSNADYATWTITATKWSTVITWSWTTFTSAMVWRFIKIWWSSWYYYKIKSYTSATVIWLEVSFQESTVSWASYTLWEIPLINEQFHIALTYYPLMVLWRRREKFDISREYERLWNDIKIKMQKFTWSKRQWINVKLRQKSKVFYDIDNRNKLITT